MPETWKGSQLELVSQEFDYDATNGRVLTETWAGEAATINALAMTMEQAGNAIRMAQEGPVKTLAIRYARWAEEDTYTEEWNHTTDIVEKSIYKFPAVVQDAEYYDKGALAYHKIIEQAVEDGDSVETLVNAMRIEAPNWYALVGDATVRQLYLERGRDVEAYETSVNVVNRKRTAAIPYPFRRTVAKPELVYSTDKLGMPSDIWIYTAASSPVQLAQTVVGWRIRAQEYTISGEQRVETIELAYAAWSTFLYTPTTASLA